MNIPTNRTYRVDCPLASVHWRQCTVSVQYCYSMVWYSRV